MDIKELESKFSEMQNYSDNQFHTINKLNTEIEKLKSENASLKIMLEGNLPNLELTPSGLGISNEQLICETQIQLLKQHAMNRELNSDEVRRFSQLFEVLEKIKKSIVNVEDVVIQKMSDDDLLKLVVNNNEHTGK